MGPVLDPDGDAPASEWTTGCEKVLPLLLSRNGELLGHLSSSCPSKAWGSEVGSVPRSPPRPLPSALPRHHARPALHMLRGSFWNTPPLPRGAQLSCLILSPPGDPPDFSLSSGVPGSSVSTQRGDHALPGEPHPPETVLLGQGHLTSSLHLQAHSRPPRTQGATGARGRGSQARGPPQVNRQARGHGPPGLKSSPAQPKRVGPSQLPGETQAPSFFGVCCRRSLRGTRRPHRWSGTLGQESRRHPVPSLLGGLEQDTCPLWALPLHLCS